MWNLFKIAKYSYAIYKMDDADGDYDYRVKSIIELYGQVLFPSNVFLSKKLRKTENGNAILDGTGYYSKEWQESTYIPMLNDKKFLNKFKPNTVGAHYAFLIQHWSLEELYNRRFSEEREDVTKMPSFFVNLMRKILRRKSNPDAARANIARHIFLSHDFWHVLFRYDTSPLGEACIQAVTHQYLRLTGPWMLSYLVGLRESVRSKSLEPLKIIREAHRLGRAVPQEFFEMNCIDMLDADVEETRKKYNIGAPIKFLKFMKENPKKAHNDCIHPEYNDPAFRLVAEAI